MYEHGQAAVADLRLRAATGPVIDDLRNRTGETAAIADSRVELVPARGNVPQWEQWEQLDAFQPLVLDDLKE